MPVTPTYPGVYIQELPSSVHTIVGVPTSVAAFVGYAAQGVVDTPVQVNSWADYERAFGGLDPSSPMSYAVYLFFLNGGNSAQIVRAGATDNSAIPAKIALSADVILVATSPGIWGNPVWQPPLTPPPGSPPTTPPGSPPTTPPGSPPSTPPGSPPSTPGSPPSTPPGSPPTTPPSAAPAPPPAQIAGLQVVVDTNNLRNVATLFNLTITNVATGTAESYTGLSLSPGAQGTAITTALASSALMTVDPSSGLTQKPAAGTYTVGTFTPPAAPGAPPVAPAPGPAGGVAGVDVAPDKLAIPGDQNAKTGIYALVKADIFNILCLPKKWTQAYDTANVIEAAAQFCFEQRAMLIIDPPTTWTPVPLPFETVVGSPAIGGQYTANAAVYYPNLLVNDPVTLATVQQGPCGAVAGVWASTDDNRGVWKAPAGTAAAITGISDLAVHIDDGESGTLNPIAVNCLRTFPLVGPVSWGARTAAGADETPSQWKYIPVRRTALFIEESILPGTKWAVFEPNDEPLWSAVRLNIGAFMNSLFKQGAFQGSTPAEAYLVQCDADNNPQSSIDLGILNILVGFQPLMPAEFVIIQIEQLAGQLQG